MTVTGDRGDLDVRRNALMAAESCVVPARRLPERVFRPGWGEFLVFDGDWVFDPAFLAAAQSMLVAEGSECICIRDLGSEHDGREPRSIWIHRSTSPEDYRAAVWGRSGVDDWRFACSVMTMASNRGTWAGYFEQCEEYVLLAFRSADGRARLGGSLAGVGAVTVSEAVAHPTIHNFEHMLPAFRDTLLRNYGSPQG